LPDFRPIVAGAGRGIDRALADDDTFAQAIVIISALRMAGDGR